MKNFRRAYIAAVASAAAFSCLAAFAQEKTDEALRLPHVPELPEGPDLPYKYVGNSFSAKFHRPSCPFAKAMDARHVILFHFRRQAIDAGQTPCRYCLPPFTTSVRAAIVPAGAQSKPDPAATTQGAEGESCAPGAGKPGVPSAPEAPLADIRLDGDR